MVVGASYGRSQSTESEIFHYLLRLVLNGPMVMVKIRVQYSCMFCR